VLAYAIKSWVVEGSLDGQNWTLIDRRTDNRDFTAGRLAQGRTSFACSHQVEARYIRLTQTDRNHWNTHALEVFDVEFFGTLLE
jgi:hypothetical protein